MRTILGQIVATLTIPVVVAVVGCRSSPSGPPLAPRPVLSASAELAAARYKLLDVAQRGQALQSVLDRRALAKTDQLVECLIWDTVSGPAYDAALCLGHRPSMERDQAVFARHPESSFDAQNMVDCKDRMKDSVTDRFPATRPLAPMQSERSVV